jgi:hypothetical protein
VKALELVQEAARRVGIMIPTTLFPTTNPDSSAIDYDANLLVSCLNATVKQNMTLSLFNKQVLDAQTQIVYKTPPAYFLDQLEDDTFRDFFLDLDALCPGFEELIGDGFIVNKQKRKLDYNSGDSFPIKNENQYIFRQLTAQDYIKLARHNLDDIIIPPTPPTPQMTDNPIKNERKEMKAYKKNMPSEDRTSILRAQNRESGFFIKSIEGKRFVFFCNNMFDPEVDIFNYTLWLKFTYRTSWGVIGDVTIGTTTKVARKNSITTNEDTLTIPDELAILGTIINYKSYYGLDFSLDMGQQKAMLDALKENQENIQITHLDKKQYHQYRT